MMLSIVYYSFSENITSEGFHGLLIINYTKINFQFYKRDTLNSFGHEDWQIITINLEPGNKVEVMVIFGEGFIVDKTTVSLLYDETVSKEMERCHVIDEEDVIVSGNDDNNVSVYDGDNEAINRFGEGTLDHMQITRHADGLYADVVGPIQPVPDYLDQPAEEIRAAEARRDLEDQVLPPEGEPERQPTVAPEAIEPTLGAQILDAIR
ncbi:TIR-NBS-LRR RCT1 resistance protein, partial [Trifolium medium]|nr:TIR-NBS-LRR RCT1 resistance protein [Trifolium medium]